ncbi:hypothetical protein DE146DRAFT_755898 [Phaeosphaeria sp. MPI-PUGE-AT-0046c]|nr:hypothetical protein DE146DRAFT_755898 [Phaeosphaeria sp. MPI-PUGE-AT-0046c]
MPRKSTRSAPTSASRSSSKRPAQDTPTRQSKRARATARQSYAEPGSDDDDESAEKQSLTSDGDDVSAVSDFNETADPSSESEQEEAATSDEDDRPKKSAKAKKSLPMHHKQGGEKELWKQGAKLAPGTQLIIKALHDPDYRAAFQDFSTFTEEVSQKIVDADELIPELPVKDVIYRIYRDVRFSSDKYVKSNERKVATILGTHTDLVQLPPDFSAAWSRTGRKGPYAHYYVQIQPKGGSFVGGGLWQPEAAALAKLRRNIDRKPHKIKEVLTNTEIRTAFLNNVADNEAKAVKAFVELPTNKSSALKRHPKGYEQSHQDIALLRLRNFTIGRKIADDEIVGPNGLGRVADLIASMVPFITYLNSVVMPDEESSDSDDGDDDSDEDEDGALVEE